MFKYMQQLMRLLPQQAAQVEAVTSRLATKKIDGEAGGGLVRAVFNGMGDMEALHLDKVVLSDATMLEDLTVAAVNNALKKVEDAQASEAESMVQDLSRSIPMDLFKGGGGS